MIRKDINISFQSGRKMEQYNRKRVKAVGHSLNEGVKLKEERCIQELVLCQEQCRALTLGRKMNQD